MVKLSRNDPCWCGSGLKYKKCHLDSDQAKNNHSYPSSKIILKTPEQIEGIRKSCQLTKKILDMVEAKIEPGLTTETINQWVHNYTIDHHAKPAPLNYKGFPKSVCTSINEVICHGIPSGYILQDGDIINVDVTTVLNGYYGDASRMFLIGSPSIEAKKLVAVAKECLEIGISKVKPFHDFSEIGQAIEQKARQNKFSVVRDYGGHGTGLEFHEEPHIHHFGTKKRGSLMLPNMTFTIEPMINLGKHKTKLLDDNWTVVSADGSLSAQWEHTLLVTETGVEILTS